MKNGAIQPCNPRLGTLTARQERFVEEYLVDRIGSAAYRRAGYVARGNAVYVCASRLLRTAKVAEAIERRSKSMCVGLNINQERVLQELASIAFSSIGDAFDAHGNLRSLAALPHDVAAGIRKLHVQQTSGKSRFTRTVTIEMRDSVVALRLLMEHLGLLR